MRAGFFLVMKTISMMQLERCDVFLCTALHNGPNVFYSNIQVQAHKQYLVINNGSVMDHH